MHTIASAIVNSVWTGAAQTGSRTLHAPQRNVTQAVGHASRLAQMASGRQPSRRPTLQPLRNVKLQGRHRPVSPAAGLRGDCPYATALQCTLLPMGRSAGKWPQLSGVQVSGQLSRAGLRGGHSGTSICKVTSPATGQRGGP